MRIRECCQRGRRRDIDQVLSLLVDSVDLPTTKTVDFYLGQVTRPSGIRRIKYYLFHGSQMQRNYCTLFFARRNDWHLVNRAFKLGLIDEIQAFAR